MWYWVHAHSLVISDVVLELRLWLREEREKELDDDHKVLDAECGESKVIVNTIL